MKPKMMYLVLFFAAIAIYACKKTSTGDPNPNPNPTGNSVTVELSKSQVKADNFDEVHIKVKDQNNNDITSIASISINNNAASKIFMTSTAGSYSVKASANGATSAVKTITAVTPGTSPFSQKIIVEDYTGTWCGYCPRVGASLKAFSTTQPKAIPIAIHGPSGSGDPYTYQFQSQMVSAFNITGYPNVIVNRDFKWNEQASVLNNELAKRAPLGISLVSTVSGNMVNVTAKVKFDVTTSVPLKIVVMLLEDGLIYPQVNYYAPTYGPNPISNYSHDYTLRRAATNIFGDDIPVDQQREGNTWTQTFSVSASGYTLSNCNIVATVVYGTNSVGKKGSLNSQLVKVGQSKAFD